MQQSINIHFSPLSCLHWEYLSLLPLSSAEHPEGEREMSLAESQGQGVIPTEPSSPKECKTSD